MKLHRLFLCVVILFSACKEKEKTNINEAVKLDIKTEEQILKKTDTIGMVYFEGGTILIGSKDAFPNAQPSFEKKIAPFYIDKNLVTVKDFRDFIAATGYITEADKFGDSGVFIFEQNNWTLLKGANWEYPLGRDQPKAIDNYPVTQVSWNDAKAYASWVGKRLPTEFEWEYAAKNGKNTADKYAWGNTLIIDGKYRANVWEGKNISESNALDGYLLTSPVGAFGETKSGLTDMGGNVWQWCENSFESYPDNENTQPVDPNLKSIRGGSFMYDQALEQSYTTYFRSQNSVDTSLFNLGFRCAK